ncbi:L,D-transpeptidase [Paraburkholderia sp. Tr-20389]|uniref:L,D-transpeptidase n=1 Tax=Paraburkholderia sp. Tr-20389 TaxID=2703903 RepID=UPI001F11EC50|nr:L,D-transpeptidase [Paraburkholderia sp. Tr-20389]
MTSKKENKVSSPPAREKADSHSRNLRGDNGDMRIGSMALAVRRSALSLGLTLAVSLAATFVASAFAQSAQAADPSQDAANPAVDASAVAAHDAVGGVDPRRAFLMRDVFASSVTRRLKVPAAEQRAYGERLQQALVQNDLGNLSGEYVVLVDRSENVQALFIYFRAAPSDAWQMIGASPVATGRPGQYDHFITPLGVFEHTPDNMDFRAEGTMNQNGIRGYGNHDMRIFDLGWAEGERGWGKGGMSQMRFQMHATDPDKLEPILGIRHSKGCVRIPASLNVFLDHYGILDRDYEALVADGRSLWVLHSNRVATPWAGRYIVVVDSQRKARPAWSPAPGSRVRAKVPASADTAD